MRLMRKELTARGITFAAIGGRARSPSNDNQAHNTLAAFCVRRATTVLMIALLLVIAGNRSANAQSADDINALNSQVLRLYGEAKYAEATPIAEQALTLAERVLGHEHPDTLVSVRTLAKLYQDQGRYGEAEPLIKRALEARERALGPLHADTLESVNDLAALYRAQHRYKEAELLYRRVLEARERVLGPDHPNTLACVNNLALLYGGQGRYNEAEPLFKRSLEGRERLYGNEHPATLIGVNNLAVLYHAQRRYSEAEPLLKRALEGRERVLGKEHSDTLVSVSHLALLYRDQGRYGEAEPLLKRALEVRERVLGKEHPFTLFNVDALAGLYFVQRDWVHAAHFWRQSTAAIAGRTQRGALGTGQAITGKKISEVEQQREQFLGLVKAAYRVGPEGHDADMSTSPEMFRTAQWVAGSEAAQSLSQMAARGATGNPSLATLVRERQDLVAEWQKRDALRNLWLGQSPDKRDAKAETENSSRLAAIDARITEIDKQLAATFPNYAALVSPAPLSIEDVKVQLRPDEALVLFLDTPEMRPTLEETFVWVVTNTDMRWVRSELGTPALTREVQALRCGLDVEAWKSGRCGELTGKSYTGADRDNGLPLAFDAARANRLYQALFGQAEDLIKGKSLIIVPSGPLTQLPFQVLVTAPPNGSDYKSAAWLIRDHAITVLPAVSSLKALRRVARASSAKKPMIGFGNPLLDGDPADANDQKRAKRARDFTACPQTVPQYLASLSSPPRGVRPLATPGGLADVSFLRVQVPLPETADELCAVARDLKASPEEIRLGSRATEREVKRLSENGQLAKYRIVHFATHGALAGQVSADFVVKVCFHPGMAGARRF